VNAAVLAAVAAFLAFAAAGPHLARALPPAAAVRLLVPATLVAAGCTVSVLATVTFTGLGELTAIARFGTWSAPHLRALDPLPAPAPFAAGALLIPIGVWTLIAVIRMVRGLLAAHRACRPLDRAPVVVLDSDDLDAFTTPGITGRIVVTTGLLAALDPAGRQALLAHEQSHRTHRHTWWTLAAELAAALNPLLRPISAAIQHATERWADEDAAAATGRRLVAATIAQVALLRTTQPSGPAVTAAATGGQVPRRVQALMRPAPRMRTRHVAAVVALTLAVAGTGLAVEHTGETLFEHAAKAPASHHA